jgi:hypothetical protein
MNINLITLVISALIIGVAGYFSYNPKPQVKIPNMRDFPFNQSTGKEKLIQSKTGDASLYTETARRKAISSAYRAPYSTKVIKESTHTKGTTSGAVEAYILSSFGRIANCNTCTTCGPFYDNQIISGNLGDQSCILYGGSPADTQDQILFGGNPSDTFGQILFGGNPSDAFGQSLFGGNPSDTRDQILFGGTPSTAESQFLFGGNPSDTFGQSLFGGIPSDTFGQNLFGGYA